MKRAGLVIAALILPASVLASVVIAESLEEMARGAPLVVRGVVGQVAPQFDEHGQGRISTYAEVKVLEVLKGPGHATVMVKSPGGELGNRGQSVAGAPKFATGQEVLLFLEPSDEKLVFLTRALAAGKIDFEKNKLGELRAVRHVEGLVFYDKATGQQLQQVNPSTDLGTPESLLAKIRSALKGGAH